MVHIFHQRIRFDKNVEVHHQSSNLPRTFDLIISGIVFVTMVVLTAPVSASYLRRWLGDVFIVVLSIDIRSGRHVCGVRSTSSRRWSGWVGTWTFLSHDIIQITFTDPDGMARWQVPVETLKERVTLISRSQLANFPQTNRYIDPHRVIIVPPNFGDPQIRNPQIDWLWVNEGNISSAKKPAQ